MRFPDLGAVGNVGRLELSVIGMRHVSRRVRSRAPVRRPGLRCEPPREVDGLDWQWLQDGQGPARDVAGLESGAVLALQGLRALDCEDPERGSTFCGLRGGPPGCSARRHPVKGEPSALRGLAAGAPKALCAVRLGEASAIPADDSALVA